MPAFYQQLQQAGSALNSAQRAAQGPNAQQFAQAEQGLADQADQAQYAQHAAQQDLAFQQEIDARKQALQARGQALQQERVQAQQQLAAARQASQARIAQARAAAQAELARLGLGQYGPQAVNQVQNLYAGTPKPPVQNLPTPIQRHASGGTQMPARPVGVDRSWRYNVTTGEWEPPVPFRAGEIFSTQVPSGQYYVPNPASLAPIPIQTTVPPGYLPQQLPMPGAAEGGPASGVTTTALPPPPPVPTTPGQEAWNRYATEHPEIFYGSYVEPAPTTIRWNGSGWTSPPALPASPVTPRETGLSARELGEANAREGLRGFAGGGQLPPAPNAETGEGQITPGNYRVELVVLPNATGVYHSEGPKLSNLPAGTKIIRVDEPNQALARELPPVPGMKVKGKPKRLAKGGTVDSAAPPLSGLPPIDASAAPALANPATGRQLPPLGNLRDLAVLSPFEAQSWDQYLRAGGQPGLEDYTARLRRTAPGQYGGPIYA